MESNKNEWNKTEWISMFRFILVRRGFAHRRSTNRRRTNGENVVPRALQSRNTSGCCNVQQKNAIGWILSYSGAQVISRYRFTLQYLSERLKKTSGFLYFEVAKKYLSSSCFFADQNNHIVSLTLGWVIQQNSFFSKPYSMWYSVTTCSRMSQKSATTCSANWKKLKKKILIWSNRAEVVVLLSPLIARRLHSETK